MQVSPHWGRGPRRKGPPRGTFGGLFEAGNSDVPVFVLVPGAAALGGGGGWGAEAAGAAKDQ